MFFLNNVGLHTKSHSKKVPPMKSFISHLIDHPAIFLQTCQKLMVEHNRLSDWSALGLDQETVMSAVARLDMTDSDHVGIAKDFIDTFLWKDFPFQEHEACANALREAQKKYPYGKMEFNSIESEWLERQKVYQNVRTLWLLHEGVTWDDYMMLKVLRTHESYATCEGTRRLLKESGGCIEELPFAYYPMIASVLDEKEGFSQGAKRLSEYIDQGADAEDCQRRLAFVVHKALQDQGQSEEAHHLDTQFSMMSSLCSSKALESAPDEIFEKMAMLKGNFEPKVHFLSIHKQSVTVPSAYAPSGFASLFSYTDARVEGIAYLGLVLRFSEDLSAPLSMRLKNTLKEPLEHVRLKVDALEQMSLLMQNRHAPTDEKSVKEFQKLLEEKVALIECTHGKNLKNTLRSRL